MLWLALLEIFFGSCLVVAVVEIIQNRLKKREDKDHDHNHGHDHEHGNVEKMERVPESKQMKKEEFSLNETKKNERKGRQK